MLLTELDETLLHQDAVTFSETMNSDHRFFDRTVVGCHGEDGTKIVVGFAVYKNMNVFESFACVQRHGKQYNLRRSRALRPELPASLRLPPIGLDVIEPFQRLSLHLDSGKEWKTSFHFDWTALYPPHGEKPHFNRKDGRIYENYLRFDQLAVVNGSLSVEGEEIEMKDWFGWRDHSWGVRPGVGNFEPVTGAGTARALSVPGADGSLLVMLWFWADDIAGTFHVIEDGHGNQFVTGGYIQFPEELNRPKVQVVKIDHEISFIGDSRVYDSAELVVTTADGETYRINAEAAGSPWTYKGTGYSEGYNDEKGLGVYRGQDIFEVDEYDVSDPTKTILPNGESISPIHREQPVNLSVNGKPGRGYMPIINWGRVRRYGLGE